MQLKRLIKKIMWGDLLPHERAIKGVVIYPIQHGAYLAVYRKDLAAGVGPGASLYVHDREILRFDCFGKGAGHYHSNISQNRRMTFGRDRRMFFSEPTVEEQIMRAAAELTENVHTHLRANRSRRIREYKLDPELLHKAVDKMKVKMLEYYECRPKPDMHTSNRMGSCEEA
ncbi:MAG: hypothetical protein Q8R76_00420 [Candidatus Omnitrophota bacterium]|nr:hypothetical protein [Candidatus Omnitrophota bacterium]